MNTKRAYEWIIIPLLNKYNKWSQLEPSRPNGPNGPAGRKRSLPPAAGHSIAEDTSKNLLHGGGSSRYGWWLLDGKKYALNSSFKRMGAHFNSKIYIVGWYTPRNITKTYVPTHWVYNFLLLRSRTQVKFSPLARVNPSSWHGDPSKCLKPFHFKNL